MESKKFKEKCKKHPDHKIDYMRINNEQGQDSSKPFFCCIYCLKEDDQINVKNYEYIKYLLKSTSQQILQKWPPNNQTEIIDKLIQIINDDNQNSSKITEQIFEFFDNLKKEINLIIDICQKRMVQIAEKLPQSTQQDREQEIGIQYQEISKIKELKQYLLNDDMKIQEKERICQELVSESQSKETINNLHSLLSKYTSPIIFDTQPAQLIQKQIIDSINSIKLFFNYNQVYQSQNNLNIEFIKSDYLQGDTKLDVYINSYNQPEVRCIQLNQGNQMMKYIFSNLILDRNLKYVFRFRLNIENKNNSAFIGLIQDEKKNSVWGGSDGLFCQLTNQGIYILNDKTKTRFQQRKGEQFKLELQESEIEFRVSISEDILQILDYPYYKSILSLDDKYLPNLKNSKQLRLFVGLYNLNELVTLTHSQIVDQFE